MLGNILLPQVHCRSRCVLQACVGQCRSANRWGMKMQLVTRLLLRLLLVGVAMMIIAMALTLAAAKRNIADEVDSSQRIGQLVTILSALQEGAPLARQA